MTQYLMPEEVVEVRAGDTGRVISFLFTTADRKSARDLTGYAGWVSFWASPSVEPHVVRSAPVSGSTGLVLYTLQGDEFATVGDCFAQASVAAADWYLGNAPARSGHVFSTDIVRFIVRPLPV